jgi:transcriptional regulator with XRE-family HTH domain
MNKKMQKGKIGSRLKGFRGVLNKTQNELHLESGVSQSNIARFENGNLLPTLDYLSFLHTKYQLNLHWLINGTGKMKVTHASEFPINPVLLEDEYILDIIEGCEFPLFKFALREKLEELKLKYREYLKERTNDESQRKKRKSSSL